MISITTRDAVAEACTVRLWTATATAAVVAARGTCAAFRLARGRGLRRGCQHTRHAIAIWERARFTAAGRTPPPEVGAPAAPAAHARPPADHTR